MKRLFVVFIVLMIATPVSAQQADEKALQVADAMMEAMGGKQAFHDAHYLRFNFAVEREGKSTTIAEHLWDKYTGRYRVEWMSGDNKRYHVLFNINSRRGKAYVDGQEISGDDLDKVLQTAYGRFINDTYWFLMPYKWRDPGVTLEYVGEKQEEGVTYDVVTLSFAENIGLTPKDRYWGYVNRATHLMEKWEFVLKGTNDPPTPFLWKNWQTSVKIKLSNEKVNPTNGVKILFPVLAVLDEVDEKVFEDPGVAMP